MNNMANQKTMSPKEKQIRIILASIIGIGFIGMMLFSKYGDTPHNREEKLIEQQLKTKEIESSNSSYESSTSTSNTSKTCSWCGKSFTGEHYTHLGKISDCYSTNSASSIGIYCSMKCCSEARRSSCPTCH